MTSFLWRPLPVTALTLRQFSGGKAIRVVAALGLLPCVFALIHVISAGSIESIEFVRDVILDGIHFTALLPITTLILATGALGNEIEDRTLPFLTLKPLGRLRIVVEKWLGCVLAGVPVICGLLAISMLIALRGDASEYTRTIAAGVAATAIGVAAYASIFMLISLVIQRALLLGMIYTFVLESTLGRFLTGFRVVSIRHYVVSIFERIQNEPALVSDNATGLRDAIIVLAVTTVIALLLSAWRLRRMSLD
jgi:ABC-2 type transport system permease protein